jgi:hypothetical protein
MEILATLWPLLFGLLLLAGLVHAIFVGMTFAVDDHHVRVRFYGWTARKVALADLAYAERDWPIAALLLNEHWTNAFTSRQIIRLRRRTGLFRNFLISPPDPAAFLAELRTRGVVIQS